MRRRKQAPVAVEGGEYCDLCGQVVPVGSDGRCDLGHRVRPPVEQDAAAAPSAPHAAPPDGQDLTMPLVSGAPAILAPHQPGERLDDLPDLDWPEEPPVEAPPRDATTGGDEDDDFDLGSALDW